MIRSLRIIKVVSEFVEMDKCITIIQRYSGNAHREK